MAPPKDDILAQITAYKLEEIAAAKQSAPVAALRDEAQMRLPCVALQCVTATAAQNKPALIAEIKKASPPRGSFVPTSTHLFWRALMSKAGRRVFPC